MTVSKKIVVATDGSVTAADATIADVFTTLISTDTVVSGLLGVSQKVGLFVAGMSFQNYRRQGSWNPL